MSGWIVKLVINKTFFQDTSPGPGGSDYGKHFVFFFFKLFIYLKNISCFCLIVLHFVALYNSIKSLLPYVRI
jgi:hypothetical protein